MACYSRSSVAERCLRLQDNAGADVNMLLTAAWLAEQGRCWQHHRVRDLIESCAGWREHCVLPLRAVRRHLKDRIEPPTLYTQAKALELEAELHQLLFLETALQPIDLKTQMATGTDALTANLQNYFDCIAAKSGATMSADWLALLEALQP